MNVIRSSLLRMETSFVHQDFGLTIYKVGSSVFANLFRLDESGSTQLVSMEIGPDTLISTLLSSDVDVSWDHTSSMLKEVTNAVA